METFIDKINLYDAYLEPYYRNGCIIDILPDDMHHLVHEHWYTYPRMKPAWHYMLGLVMILLGILGKLVNFYSFMSFFSLSFFYVFIDLYCRI